MDKGYIEKYKTYKGYIIAPGVTMPAQDIYEYEIFENFEQYEEHNPVHTAENETEAEQWVDRQVELSHGSTYPPRKGIIPKLPEEARGDFLFYEYIRDLAKYEALSEEDAQRLWEGYKRQQRR